MELQLFWASGSPLEDCNKNQLLASSICRLMSAASFLWTMWRVFTSSQLFLEKNSAGSSTPRKSIHRTTTVRSKTPTLMCIQRVVLVQSLRLIHGFTKVSEHCYSAEMMPTFLFCCFPLICSSWGRCPCGRHLNASMLTWFNACEKCQNGCFEECTNVLLSIKRFAVPGQTQCLRLTGFPSPAAFKCHLTACVSLETE